MLHAALRPNRLPSRALRRRLPGLRTTSWSWHSSPQANAGCSQDFAGNDGLPASGDMQVRTQEIERTRRGIEQAGNCAIAIGYRSWLGRKALALNQQRNEALVELAQLLEKRR